MSAIKEAGVMDMFERVGIRDMLEIYKWSIYSCWEEDSGELVIVLDNYFLAESDRVYFSFDGSIKDLRKVIKSYADNFAPQEYAHADEDIWQDRYETVKKDLNIMRVVSNPYAVKKLLTDYANAIDPIE